MAYFFWEDDGIERMLAEFEPDFLRRFTSLPSNVERADVFRILVLKWFGGIVSGALACRREPLTLTSLVCRRRHAAPPPTGFLDLGIRPRGVVGSRHGHGVLFQRLRQHHAGNRS